MCHFNVCNVFNVRKGVLTHAVPELILIHSANNLFDLTLVPAFSHFKDLKHNAVLFYKLVQATDLCLWLLFNMSPLLNVGVEINLQVSHAKQTFLYMITSTKMISNTSK